MNWKKILSLLIVSVLVIGGLTVMAGHTRAQDDDGILVEEVNFDVVLDMEDGVAATFEGDTHLFMHGVDGVRYQGLDEAWRIELETWDVLGSYNNLLLNPAHEGSGTPEIDEAIDEGWIDEPEDIRWLANNADGDWTINPLANEDIRFALQYLDREAIVEDLLDGLGIARYTFMSTAVGAYGEHFEEAINEQFDLGPEGDEDYMEAWIEEAMNEMAEEIPFGELTGNPDDGWFFEHPESGTDEHQIEIVIMARSEDWRQDLGDWLEELLEGVGFDVYVDPTPADEAIPRAFFGEPEPYDNLDYHIYTGGWVSTTTVAFQQAACAQMYTDYYGQIQVHSPTEHWNYNEEDFDRLIGAHDGEANGYEGRGWTSDWTVENLFDNAAEVMAGQGMADTDEYWERMVDNTVHGFFESARIFVTTGQDFYPYNPDKMIAAVPEATNGYDTYFGPRTMRTDDGQLNTEILTGEVQPYMDHWNLFGGSADVYGEYQRRILREYGSWLHPADGIPMQVNNFWMDNEELSQHRPERMDPYDRQGETIIDFDFDDDDELIKNIEVPSDAVNYVPAEREWQTVDEMYDGEDQYSAVEVTIDVHEDHVWHDGTDFDLQDLMASYARNKELADDTHEPYLSAWEGEMGSWFDNIVAIEWNEDEGTYTAWGNYAFPVDELIGDYFSMSAEVHPLTYEGWNHLHGGEDTEYGGIVDEDYDYEPREGYEWIHQISSSQNEDLVTVLEAMRDDEWIPPYLREDNNAPMPMDEVELTTQLDSVIDFIETYEHSYIGIGPFMLEEYDEDDHTMSMVRWDDYGYPFAGEEVTFDHWEIDLTSPEDGAEFTEGDEVTVDYTVDAQYEDTQDIVFTVNGEEVDSEELTLGEGEQEIVEFPYGYWAEQFEIEGIRLDFIDAPEELDLGEDIEASGTGSWETLFPEPEIRELTEDDLDSYRFTLRDEFMGTEIYETVTMDDIELTPEDGFSTFDATIPTDEVPEGGTYTLQLEARSTPDEPWTIVTHTITLFEEGLMSADVEDTTIAQNDDEYSGSFTWTARGGDHELGVATDDDHDSVMVSVETLADVVAQELTVDGEDDEVEIEEGDEAEIEGLVEELTGEHDGMIDLEILDEDGDVVESWSYDVPMGEEVEIDEVFEFEDAGEYTVELGDLSVTVIVEEVEEVPGFTMGLFILGTGAAVAIYSIYYKKDE